MRAAVMRAAVADQNHAAQPEALLELGDLRRKRRGVAGLAGEGFAIRIDRGQGTAVAVAEQAPDGIWDDLMAGRRACRGYSRTGPARNGAPPDKTS